MRRAVRRLCAGWVRGLAPLLIALTSSIAFASTTTSYTYDAWGRLTSVTYAGGLTTAYVYDAAGNRTTVTTAAPPVANSVALTVAANSSSNPVALSVSGSYTSVLIATSPAHGTATANGTTITYKPTTSYAGPDSFTYTATNASGVSAPATVQVAVAPLANGVSHTVAYGSANNHVPLSVTGAYTGVAIASFASHGTATPSGLNIAYTPAAGYSGADSFQYSASNAVATSAPANVSMTVNPQPPIANNVSASVPIDTTNTPIPLNITGGAPVSVAVASQASHGTATAGGVSITYTPDNNYVGADSFTYTATNTGGTSGPATATITVTPLTVTATYAANCPSGAPTYVCGSGTVSSNTFTSNPASLTITGGSGSYAYLWSAAGDSFGTWTTGQTTASVTPAVSGVLAQTGSTATYTCTVTDTVRGTHATSNGLIYTWENTKGGG